MHFKDNALFLNTKIKEQKNQLKNQIKNKPS